MFKIFNINYRPQLFNGSLSRRKRSTVTLPNPWCILTPKGDYHFEASFNDAVLRMNILINE